MVYHGYNVVPDSCIFSPLHDYYTPVTDPDKNFIRYDPELAKQKLIDAGYSDGITVRCLYENQTEAAMAEAVQHMFAQVGITMVPEPGESAVISAQKRAGEFEITLSSSANPSPSRSLGLIDPRVNFVGANGYCGDAWYGDYDIEALLDRCRYTVDDVARTAALTELNDLTRELVPKIVVSAPMLIVFTSPEIEGLKMDSKGVTYLWSMYPSEYLTGK